MRAVRCPKCQAMCLLAMVDGFKAAVDPTPLGVGGVRETVMAGRSLYGPMYGFRRSRDAPRQLRGLRLLTASTLGAHLRDGNQTHGEHGCGNAAFSSVPMDAPPKGLSGPSATFGGLVGGFPPSDAHEGSSGPPVASSHPPPVTSATRHPSELFASELGASVLEIKIHGRTVFRNE